MTFRPMLSAKLETLDGLTYPLVASPKLDGIRCIAMNSKPMSRTMKVIRNRHVQAMFAANAKTIDGLDGELIVGDPTHPDVYRITNSAVMSEDGEPDFDYYVFDRWDTPKADWCDRNDYNTMLKKVGDTPSWMKIVDSEKVENREHLEAIQNKYLALGYEGVMLRDPDTKYKQGRSTLKERGLMKLKQFSDMEAVIVGFTELMHNGNEATVSELGLTKRSRVSANLVPMGVLGNFVVQGIQGREFPGIEFEVGTGLTADDRRQFWEQKDALLGKIIKVKYFSIGVLDKPRFPVFLGFRDEIDIS